MKSIMLANYIGLVLSMICMIACQPKYQNPKPVAEFSISNDITAATRFTGSYVDKETAQEEIYFADIKAKKKLYFFNHQGELQDSINLKAFNKVIPDIDGIVVQSKDTIFAFSKKSNIVSSIDRTGAIIKTLDLNQIYPNSDQVKYEFTYANIANQSLNTNKILMACSWLTDTIYPQVQDAYEALNYFYEKEYNSPRFIQIKDFFKPTAQIDFKLPKFYARIKDAPHAFIESSSFKQIHEDLIIYYSVYSNKLFLLNKDIEITNEINLESDFTRIGLKPIELKPKSLRRIQELTNYNYHNRGFIRNIFYDQKSKRFFLIILTEHQGKPKTQQDPSRAFVVMILDQEFNKLKEVLFDDESYEGANSFFTQKGLFLKKISRKLIDNEKSYAIFNLD